MTSPRFTVRLAAIALAALLAAPGFAQQDAARSFPNKTVRLIVPYGAGGGNDLLARLFAVKMAEGLGQPVVVENKPGASAIVGSEYVAKSPPDGYTLLVAATGPMTVNPAIYDKLPYSTLRDFAPISAFGTFPLLIVVNPSLPVKSIKELVEYAKARPNNVFYASAAASFQLAGELFKQKTGTTFVHVPYKSSAEILQAVLANQVTMGIVDIPPMTGPLKSGQIRALAVLAGKRLAQWPDLPSVGEMGLPETEVLLFIGLVAPAATPPAIVKRLQQEVARAVSLPDIRERLVGMSIEPSGNTPEEFARLIAKDLAKNIAVAKAAKITAKY